MKKLIIFFIVMVTLTTIAIMGSLNKKVPKEQIDKYRQSLQEENKYSKKELEEKVKEYEEKYSIKGITFGGAFKMAFKISAVVCIIVGLFFLYKGSYYNEILRDKPWVEARRTTFYGRYQINNLRAKENFWGRWFK